MSDIGFGSYRVSVASDEHFQALEKALKLGVKYIDTSANYTGGESEKLIAKVLKKNPHFKPTIISKVGYLQGDNLELADTFEEDLVDFAPDLKHSIHPDFIEDQIHRSLDRLELKSLDVYLLHNPEYYLKMEGSTKEEYYRRIAFAFNKLEELVKRGKIRSYGISSNTFIDPKDNKTSTDIDVVYNIALKISENHHFKYIQFPMNIIEMGALERQFSGKQLIERAQEYGLKTIINRPLNAFTEHGLLRLATYQVDSKYEQDGLADKLFNDLISPLVVKWIEVREDADDKLFELPLLQQIMKLWHSQYSKDAVDQIFMAHFFPLIASIWGRDLKPSESRGFYELYDHALEFTKVNMNKRAVQFEEQAISSGLLNDSKLSLSRKVIEKYAGFNVDIILVGMRKPEYVESLKDLIK